jgi:hypothetical protein
MAAETPFGLSFGDPRRYMGKSPLASIGEAAKLGLVLQGLQKSGAIKALDSIGIKQDDQGKFGYKMPKPAGSVPPITSGAAGDMNTNGVFGTNPMAVSPSSLSQPVMGATPVPPAAPAAPGVQITPIPDSSPSNVQINTLAPPPPDAGQQLMNNTFRPQSSAVDVTNETDFNTFVPDMGNQMAISPNDYMNNPGYGKLQKIAGQFMGMG